jgi:hypothetical protein
MKCYTSENWGIVHNGQHQRGAKHSGGKSLKPVLGGAELVSGNIINFDICL